MRKQWSVTPFGTAPVQIIDGDRGKKYPKQNDFMSDGHCLFLNTGNVTQLGFNFTDVQFVSESKDNELRKGKLKRGDVVLTTRGTIGNVAYYRDDILFEHIRINSGMVILRCEMEKISPSFLYCYLRSSLFTGQTRSMQSGAAQPQLPIRDLNKIKIPIPPIAEQQKISEIISAYDDLIENNRRRIDLLEQSAHMLYKEWFVSLRFPGHEHVKVKAGAPQGWEKAVFADIGEYVRDSVRPEQVDPQTPYIGLEHMPRKSITLMDWGSAEDVTSNKFRFVEGDILFGKIRPYFHKVGFALTDGITSSDAIVMRPTHEKFFAYLLMTASSEHFVKMVSQTVKEGSKMPRANWDVMQQYPVFIPSDNVLYSFSEVIENIVKQLKALALQNQKLQQARDLILPRLMNGEIPV